MQFRRSDYDVTNTVQVSSVASVRKAVEELGGSLSDVVRTRMYIIDPADADLVGDVHGDVFRDTRPVATMVVVKALLRDEWLVEIEAEALVEGQP